MADARPTDDDLSPAADPRRFGRFTPLPHGRKIMVSRAGRLAVAFAILVGVSLVGGSTVLDKITSWLRHQPVYSLDLDHVQFIEPVPAWVVGGETKFLECLRPFVREPISIHDVNLSAISTELSKNPWVYRVERVSTAFPNRLSIDLVFRKPIGCLRAEGKLPIVFDNDLVILPDDLDLKATGPLISLFVKRVPIDVQPGLPLSKSPENEPLIAEMQLTVFLAERFQAAPEALPTSAPIALYVEKTGLWVELSPGNFLYWGVLTGPKAANELSRDEKWGLILDRVKKSGPLKPIEDRFYLFTKQGIELQARPKSGG